MQFASVQGQLCRVLSGEIGLGEKQDVHAHISRPHPFYPVIFHFKIFLFPFHTSANSTSQPK